MTAWLKLVEQAFTDKAALTAHIEAARQVEARRTTELHAAGIPASIKEMKALKDKKPARITASNKRKK